MVSKVRRVYTKEAFYTYCFFPQKRYIRKRPSFKKGRRNGFSEHAFFETAKVSRQVNELAE